MRKYLAVALVCLSLVGCSDKQEMKAEKQFEYHENIDYVSFEYKITSINKDGFYGDSTQDDTKIFFTKDNVSYKTHIKVGDTVEAIFEKENVSDGIVEVVKKGEK